MAGTAANVNLVLGENPDGSLASAIVRKSVPWGLVRKIRSMEDVNDWQALLGFILQDFVVAWEVQDLSGIALPNPPRDTVPAQLDNVDGSVIQVLLDHVGELMGKLGKPSQAATSSDSPTS